MYPILIEWGSFVLPAWHTFLALGAIAGFYTGVYLNRSYKLGYDERDLSWLFIVTYICGYFGARTFSILVEEPDVTSFSEFVAASLRFGPMTFYGSVIGAFVGGVIFVRLRGLPLSGLIDMSFVALMVGLAFGRIGCFLNGDDFGREVALAAGASAPWWSVSFPNHNLPVPRIPTQLIEVATALLIAAGATLAFRRIRERFFPGAVAHIVIASYALYRFFAEYLRGDMRGWLGHPDLSPSQFTSIVVLLAVNISFVYCIVRKARLN